MTEVTLIAFFFAAFVSIITIVNPLSTTTLFLTITAGDSDEKRRWMARRASIVTAITLIAFALLGNFILNRTKNGKRKKKAPAN
jgi:multiple antibiotic resistance protein